MKTYRDFVNAQNEGEVARVEYIVSEEGFDNTFDKIVDFVKGVSEQSMFTEVSIKTTDEEDNWSDVKVIISLGNISSPPMKYDELYDLLEYRENSNDMVYQMLLDTRVNLNKVNAMYPNNEYLRKTVDKDELIELKEDVKKELFK